MMILRYNVLKVQANTGKDLEQNRPGKTNFRSRAVKKPKPGSEEVSRISISPRQYLYISSILHPSLIYNHRTKMNIIVLFLAK